MTEYLVLPPLVISSSSPAWTRLRRVSIALTYEMFPFLPGFAGHDSKVNVVLGKKSGRDSITYKGRKIGVNIPEDKIDSILLRVKDTSEEKKRILTDEEFLKIVKEIVPNA
ncbi:MAG: hypothetical protein JRN15_23585 [Nitrososphaerota archaeon]|nr:hypothetical protein [Nitrososphaerota archaeon]